MPLVIEDKKKYPFVKECSGTPMSVLKFHLYIINRDHLIRKLKKKNIFECCICYGKKAFHMPLCNNNHNDYVCLRCAKELDRCPICNGS